MLHAKPFEQLERIADAEQRGFRLHEMALGVMAKLRIDLREKEIGIDVSALVDEQQLEQSAQERLLDQGDALLWDWLHDGVAALRFVVVGEHVAEAVVTVR